MQTNPPRLDLYAFIHKALRAYLSHTLLLVGRTDPNDRDDTQQALIEVRNLLAFCRSHLDHEDRHIHTAMEARCPGSSARTDDEHVDHALVFDRLMRLTVEAEYGVGPAQPPAWTRLYRELALFAAEQFEHMEAEESDNNAILWATYTDAELDRIRQDIVASIPTWQTKQTLRWMLPHLTPAERTVVMTGLRDHAPEGYRDVMDMVQPLLPAKDWGKLTASLGAKLWGPVSVLAGAFGR